ncbi:hypothetical protein MUK42_02844 [Musa troglodytarum]|uniref:AP complex mu/sigma subunit domain-containing protein n=1 Tax=Musa troglodytarum TaxID=320322 RepID=A0A9E7JGL2_9LILI|nr:hypothetical protein MUK42_02844 [Musa troglodytarum]
MARASAFLDRQVHRLVVDRDPKFTNFVEVYLILDEFILAGEIQETSKRELRMKYCSGTGMPYASEHEKVRVDGDICDHFAIDAG